MSRLRLNAVSCLLITLILPHTQRAAAEERALSVEGIEVTQSIQSLDHDVPLIAGKPTAARVYLSLRGSGPLTIKGRLSGSRGSTSLPEVESTNTVRFSIADNLTLQQKRASEARSLNFLLPASWILEGAVELSVTVLHEANGGPVECDNCASKAVEVTFEKDAPLRVRLLGIRYRLGNPVKAIAPEEVDFALTESWLRRAYPVGQVISSRGSTDANPELPLECNAVNAQISALRALDISGGVDPRTHYYGIVGDNNGANFMGGCASGIPSSAEPATVASGPAGKPNFDEFKWDRDRSYADWYTAHELGHTFGRKHPGFCSESKDDTAYPFPNGSLSDGDKYMGWDFGDPGNEISMRALGGSDWHDVMTYCEQQWLSQYTYLGIRQRLIAEEGLSTVGAALAAPAVPAETTRPLSSRGRDLSDGTENRPAEAGATPRGQAEARGEGPAEPGEDLPAMADAPQNVASIEEGTFVSVVATINLTKKSGKILYVNPVSKGLLSTDGRVESPAAIRLRGAEGGSDVEIPVVIKLDTDRNQDGDETGLVDALIPLSANVRAMELLLHGTLVDARSFGSSAPQVTRLQIDTKENESRSGFSIFRRTEVGPTVLLWDGLDPDGDSVTYSVQKSSDLGATWETLAVGLKKRELELDQDPRESPVGIMFRIIATDGLNSTYTTTTAPVRHND